ncbi:hypothetical protein ACJX0J_040165, partial [Zea mays]
WLLIILGFSKNLGFPIFSSFFFAQEQSSCLKCLGKNNVAYCFLLLSFNKVATGVHTLANRTGGHTTFKDNIKIYNSTWCQINSIFITFCRSQIYVQVDKCHDLMFWLGSVMPILVQQYMSLP